MSEKSEKHAYRITEWRDRYEVSYKGDVAKPADKLRAGKLSFVRLKVHGHSMGTGLRRLKSIAGPEKVWGVFGIFCKFLEIAGNSRSDLRGWLLNEKGNIATADDLAFILDAPIDQVEFALQTLCNKQVAWIEAVTVPENSGNSGKIPGSYITEPNETELNSTQPNGTEMEITADEKSLKSSSESVESDRIKLYDAVVELFAISKKEDFEAIRKICDRVVDMKHLGHDDIFKIVWEMAKNSKKGRNPIALFISKFNTL